MKYRIGRVKYDNHDEQQKKPIPNKLFYVNETNHNIILRFEILFLINDANPFIATFSVSVSSKKYAAEDIKTIAIKITMAMRLMECASNSNATQLTEAQINTTAKLQGNIV